MVQKVCDGASLFPDQTGVTVGMTPLSSGAILGRLLPRVLQAPGSAKSLLFLLLLFLLLLFLLLLLLLLLLGPGSDEAPRCRCSTLTLAPNRIQTSGWTVTPPLPIPESSEISLDGGGL